MFHVQFTIVKYLFLSDSVFPVSSRSRPSLDWNTLNNFQCLLLLSMVKKFFRSAHLPSAKNLIINLSNFCNDRVATFAHVT